MRPKLIPPISERYLCASLMSSAFSGERAPEPAVRATAAATQALEVSSTVGSEAQRESTSELMFFFFWGGVGVVVEREKGEKGGSSISCDRTNPFTLSNKPSTHRASRYSDGPTVAKRRISSLLSEEGRSPASRAASVASSSSGPWICRCCSGEGGVFFVCVRVRGEGGRKEKRRRARSVARCVFDREREKRDDDRRRRQRRALVVLSRSRSSRRHHALCGSLPPFGATLRVLSPEIERDSSREGA